jgi:hypothetical protein
VLAIWVLQIFAMPRQDSRLKDDMLLAGEKRSMQEGIYAHLRQYHPCNRERIHTSSNDR